MAKLDARMDDFIGLVLDVSGRARPSDIQGVDQNEAAELLRQYRSEHPERRLVFGGDTLIPESGAPSAAPSPVPAYGAAVAQPPASAPDQWPAAAQAAPAAQPAAAEHGFGDSSYGMPAPGGQVPSAGAAYGTPPAYGSPQPAPAAPFHAAPGTAPVQPPANYAAQPPYVEQVPPASDWQGSADPFANEPAAESPSEPRVAWYWWLLPVLFSWLGGLIAWLALRDRQPRAAKRLLVLGLVMTVVMIALSALLMALGLAAFLTPVTTGTTVETSLTTVTPTP